jgi:hypothetical protein
MMSSLLAEQIESGASSVSVSGSEMAEVVIRQRVAQERLRQDRQWGRLPREISNGQWLAVLGEEYGEVCKDLLERGDLDCTYLITELVHVASVAQSWAADLLIKSVVNKVEPDSD